MSSERVFDSRRHDAQIASERFDAAASRDAEVIERMPASTRWLFADRLLERGLR